MKTIKYVLQNNSFKNVGIKKKWLKKNMSTFKKIELYLFFLSYLCFYIKKNKRRTGENILILNENNYKNVWPIQR